MDSLSLCHHHLQSLLCLEVAIRQQTKGAEYIHRNNRQAFVKLMRVILLCSKFVIGLKQCELHVLSS